MEFTKYGNRSKARNASDTGKILKSNFDFNSILTEDIKY
jgi:hypothetical protein